MTNSLPRRKFVLEPQSRLLVQRLYEYFQKECNNNGPLLSVRKVQGRVADALGISPKTVGKVVREAKTGEPTITRWNRKPRKSPKTNVDLDNENAIRNIIYGFYERKEWPTFTKLMDALKEANVFHGGKTSLKRLMSKLNFQWEQVNKKKYLMEKSDIVTARCIYLRQIQQCDLAKVIFLGEHAVKVVDCLGKTPTGRPNRIILAHAGCAATGFIPNSFQSIRSKGVAYTHKEVDADAYRKWFLVLLQNIPPNSKIVMYNDPPLSIAKYNVPTDTWKVEEIQYWLTSNNVEWCPKMSTGQLLDLVKNKPLLMQCELDQLAQANGHTVSRIPPNHCHFNAMELIWQQIKEIVDTENETFTLTQFETLIRSAVDSITSEDWENAIKITAKNIELALNKEKIVEENFQEMLTLLNDGNKVHSDSEDEAEEEEEGAEDMVETDAEMEWTCWNH